MRLKQARARLALWKGEARMCFAVNDITLQQKRGVLPNRL